MYKTDADKRIKNELNSHLRGLPSPAFLENGCTKSFEISRADRSR